MILSRSRNSYQLGGDDYIIVTVCMQIALCNTSIAFEITAAATGQRHEVNMKIGAVPTNSHTDNQLLLTSAFGPAI